MEEESVFGTEAVGACIVELVIPVSCSVLGGEKVSVWWLQHLKPPQNEWWGWVEEAKKWCGLLRPEKTGRTWSVHPLVCSTEN